MPFPFVIGTTSHLTFQTSFTSSTHPSLPSTATSYRNIVRSALKSHKRLGSADQSSNLNSLAASILEYLKYLNAIDFGLSGKQIAGEDVEIALTKDVEVEWRPTLSASSIPGREPDRLVGKGLDYEIYFIHQKYAVVQNLLARQALLGLYASINPTAEQRISLIQNALKYLRSAYSIHDLLNTRTNSADGGSLSFPPSAADISPIVQTGLLRLTHAEVNLLFVLKDDPYPALLIQSRNKDDKEWMIKAPTIPKVRAQVLTRLCIGASEHASAASAALHAGTHESKKLQISKDLIEYVDDVRRTARARACRFQALDNDISGSTGQAIAWLHAGLNELGLDAAKHGATSNQTTGSTKAGLGSGISKLKTAWTERREDKKIYRGSASWGSDGGKIEEGRILDYLLRKFTKANDTVNVQIVPEWRPLLATLPSGMNMPVTGGGDNSQAWVSPSLTEDDLIMMRGPPELDDNGGESSGEDEGGAIVEGDDPIGAFPGTQNDYKRTEDHYY